MHVGSRALHILEAAENAGLAGFKDPYDCLIFANIVATVQNPAEAGPAHVPADALEMIHQHPPIPHLQGQQSAVIGRLGVPNIHFR